MRNRALLTAILCAVALVGFAGRSLHASAVHQSDNGTISGRIMDEAGNPAVAVDVVAGVFEQAADDHRLAIVKRTRTNEDGDYRLSGLPAGKFVVAVGGGGGRATRWTTTFYPGTWRLGSAQPIAVDAGQDIRDINFTAWQARMHALTISGTVIQTDGRTAAGRFTFGTVNDPVSNWRIDSVLMTGGTFLVRVDPGEYLVTARGDGGGVASLRLSVVDREVTGLRLVLRE